MYYLASMKSITLLVLILLSLHISAQEELCYGKAIMPSVYASSHQLYPIYIGENTDADYLKSIDFTMEPARIALEERINENCLSPNPEDCIMVCEVMVPAKIKKKYVVVDTTQTDEYLWENLKVESLVKQGGYEEYVTVICGDKIDETFVAQISQVLAQKNYYGGGVNKIFSEALKQALIQFQKDNGLPEGQLDLVTLSKLGFGYQ